MDGRDDMGEDERRTEKRALDGHTWGEMAGSSAQRVSMMLVVGTRGEFCRRVPLSECT